MFHFPAEFTPKLITRLAEGYRWADLRADAVAGLTVAIVALPLSMAIAIASGVGPERGLYTAIVGGFLVSALGGSRYQIGGPVGAFIVVVAGCVAETGLNGLILATLMSGAMLTVLGLLRVGSLVRYIPVAVALGFTTGIGVIIFISQVRYLAGMSLPTDSPAVLEKLLQLWQARATVTPIALAMGVAVIALISLLRRTVPRAPSLLIAVAVAALAAWTFDLPVETVYDRFGALPHWLPWPSLPQGGAAQLRAALPWALSFTLLGMITSLLSAAVADAMTGNKHRANAEMVAQGIANMGSAMFGGFCVAGGVARTITNLRQGARSPIAGILHAMFIMAFLALAAPLAGYIPLCAFAGMLALVSWNMIDRSKIAHLTRQHKIEAIIALITFSTVVLYDLVAGIMLGSAVSAAAFGVQKLRTKHKPSATK